MASKKEASTLKGAKEETQSFWEEGIKSRSGLGCRSQGGREQCEWWTGTGNSGGLSGWDCKGVRGLKGPGKSCRGWGWGWSAAQMSLFYSSWGWVSIEGSSSSVKGATI